MAMAGTSPGGTIIYGAGVAGLAAHALLTRRGTCDLVGFVDGSPRRQGTRLLGLPVAAPDTIGGPERIVIASQAWREIAGELLAAGVERRRISVYHHGSAEIAPLPPGPPAAPTILVVTDDCVSPGHGTGAVLLRHLAGYPADRLVHAYLRRKGDPFWPNSHALAVDGTGIAGSITPAALAGQLHRSGLAPDVVYANVFGEPGLEAIEALAAALGGRTPIVQHFHDLLWTDETAFDRVLIRVAPSIDAFWAITDGLGQRVASRIGRPVETMNTFKCDIAPSFKREHRGLDDRFQVVMLGNAHMPWVLHHVRQVWRRLAIEVPGLRPIRWFAYPTSALYVRDAGVDVEPEIEYYGYLNDRRLHEQLCRADLALVPFNVADDPEYHYAEYSVPSRITEFLNAGVPIFAAAGRHTETWRFLTGHGVGCCATIGDEASFGRALLGLMRDTPRRMALGRRGRAFAEAHCDVRAYRRTLRDALVRVSGWAPPSIPSIHDGPLRADEELHHA
ncbi:MAG: hypothetical protein IT176_03835 [Acidobacteria bacterium]|nr:hypothetical protein [Acidobacteriota bacterium]